MQLYEKWWEKVYRIVGRKLGCTMQEGTDARGDGSFCHFAGSAI
jgi:radical SAM superfamily enzyme